MPFHPDASAFSVLGERQAELNHQDDIQVSFVPIKQDLMLLLLAEVFRFYY